MLGLPYDEADTLELGFGAFGVVFRRGNDRVVKVPMIFHDNPIQSRGARKGLRKTSELNIRMHEREVKTIEALGAHPSLVTTFNASNEHGIEMKFLENGNLEDYILLHPRPDLGRVLQWILHIAEGLQYMHGKGIMHSDIALRNVLLDRDLNAKLIDFSGSSVEAETSRIEDDVSTEIFHFANIAYSLLAWQEYELDIREYVWDYDWEAISAAPLARPWPGREDLPSVDNISCGDVILNYWLQKYEDMGAVCAALNKRIQEQQVRDLMRRSPILGVIHLMRMWVFNFCTDFARYYGRVWARIWFR